MAGPDVGKRPSKKKTIKKGTPSRRPGGMGVIPSAGKHVKRTVKLQTLQYQRKGWKKAEEFVKDTYKKMRDDPKYLRKKGKALLKKKPITHMAKKVKSWFS